MCGAGALARQFYPRNRNSISLRLLYTSTFGVSSFPDLFHRCLRGYHLIRLLDQILQLIPPDRFQPVQHYPLVASDIRGGTNVLAFNQFGENFRRAFEAEPRIVQAEHAENLSANFEAEVVAPLQMLGRLRE